MELYRQLFSSMGCPCEVRVFCDDPKKAAAGIGAAIDEVNRLDRKYSLYRDDSLLSRINQSAGTGESITVDAETAALLDYAAAEYQLSDGLFDITAGALWRVWDFRSGKLPSAEDIRAALGRTGWEKVQWESPELNLPLEAMTLDLGGIAKEYAADRAAVMLRERGLRHALVDLGGDICVSGPQADGTGWPVGIRNPEQPQVSIARISLASGGLATSGDYERCMVVDGVRYGHILNPKTGWPVNGLASVSVQASSCLAAGAISTLAVLKGKSAAAGFLGDTGLPYLSVDQAGQISSGAGTSHEQAPENISPALGNPAG